MISNPILVIFVLTNEQEKQHFTNDSKITKIALMLGNFLAQSTLVNRVVPFKFMPMSCTKVLVEFCLESEFL